MNLPEKTIITLAIESAVRGGSIALLRGTQEIASAFGSDTTSKAEDLLPAIEKLLNESGIKKEEISRLAISNGPGSFTGIRIGLATAFGLAEALKIPCIGVSLFEAVVGAFAQNESVVVAVPMGRKDICWQFFQEVDGKHVSSGEAVSNDESVFLDLLSDLSGHTVLLYEELFEKVGQEAGLSCVNIGRNLALPIGISSNTCASDLRPKYVQNSKYKGGGI